MPSPEWLRTGFVGLVTAYMYLYARTRAELAPAADPSELPAEIELFAAQ